MKTASFLAIGSFLLILILDALYRPSLNAWSLTYLKDNYYPGKYETPLAVFFSYLTELGSDETFWMYIALGIATLPRHRAYSFLLYVLSLEVFEKNMKNIYH